MKKIKTLEDAKLQIEAWQEWAQAVEFWLVDVVQRKRMTKDATWALQQLFDWDVLAKGIPWADLMASFKEVEDNKYEFIHPSKLEEDKR